MKNRIKRFIITAAFPYANGPIHIGHLAGVYIPADIITRYLRRKGEDVIFISGSDEHGAPISIRAMKENVSPKKIVEKYHLLIKNSLKSFGISFDNYSRTSSNIHYKIATNFFKKLYNNSVFIEKISDQYYDNKNQHFLADRYVLGICPNCSYSSAYGDQCEKCGMQINPEELIDPKSVLSGKKLILKKTNHWYLPLNMYHNFLQKWLLCEKKNYWKNNVINQVKSWLNKGLKERSVTRDLDWGVPVPIKGIKNKVLYVWFDAPIGYISATVEFCLLKKKDWKLYWQNEETALINFIGKDNIVFHCIIFPVMLKAHGKYILPYNVPANEFLNLENKKISTSKNWAVWLHEFLEDFPNQQDSLRYVLTSNMPENKDNNFSWKDFQLRFNSELVDILGNFINRTLTLTERYYQNKVPNINILTENDKNILIKIKKYPKYIGFFIEKYHFRNAISEFINIARLGNKYLTEESPWMIYNSNPVRVQNIIYVSLQIVGMIAQLSEPFLPKTCKKLCKILNIKLYNWYNLINLEILPSGHILSKNSILFKKIKDIDIEKQINKLKNLHI